MKERFFSQNLSTVDPQQYRHLSYCRVFNEKKCSDPSDWIICWPFVPSSSYLCMYLYNSVIYLKKVCWLRVEILLPTSSFSTEKYTGSAPVKFTNWKLQNKFLQFYRQLTIKSFIFSQFWVVGGCWTKRQLNFISNPMVIGPYPSIRIYTSLITTSAVERTWQTKSIFVCLFKHKGKFSIFHSMQLNVNDECTSPTWFYLLSLFTFLYFSNSTCVTKGKEIKKIVDVRVVFSLTLSFVYYSVLYTHVEWNEHRSFLLGQGHGQYYITNPSTPVTSTFYPIQFPKSTYTLCICPSKCIKTT